MAERQGFQPRRSAVISRRLPVKVRIGAAARRQRLLSAVLSVPSGLPDRLTRLSLVIGIYKNLQILYPEPEFADRWVRMPNSHELFGGRPALSVMTDAGIDGLYRVRRLLDGRRGGWN